MMFADHTTALPATTICTVPVDGPYLVLVNHEVHSVGTAGTLATTIRWTNTHGVKSATPAGSLAVTSLGHDHGMVYIVASAGTAVTAETSMIGLLGTPHYTLAVTVIRP